jgi:DNA-binding response OmpR family regulator
MYVRPIETYRPSVLVIDGSAAIRNGIETALSLRGLRIFSVSDPRKIQAAIQAKPIDLVLTDLLSGYRGELIVAIRDIVRRSPGIVPIVAMSERTMWEDLEMFSAAGATAVLCKPFSAIALLQLLNGLFHPTFSGADGGVSQRLARDKEAPLDEISSGEIPGDEIPGEEIEGGTIDPWSGTS